MDKCKHKISELLSSFVLFFEMGIGLGISYKFKSPSTCEIWHFNPSFFSLPFYLP
jgi:hypothetical protein